jgi:hypothetical protein
MERCVCVAHVDGKLHHTSKHVSLVETPDVGELQTGCFYT